MGRYYGREDKPRGMPTPVGQFLKENLRDREAFQPGLLYVSETLEELLYQGRVTCMFDALDEMPQDSYRERYSLIRNFMVKWEVYGNRFVCSCRTTDYDSSLGVDRVIIGALDHKAIRAIVASNLPESSERFCEYIFGDERLRELAANPAMLQALITVFGSAERFPPTRSELLRKTVHEVINERLQKEAREKQREALASVPGGIATLQEFLGKLALALQTTGASVRTETLGSVWSQYPHWQTLLLVARRAHILNGARRSPGSLVGASLVHPQPPERVEFVHRVVQEVLASDEQVGRQI